MPRHTYYRDVLTRTMTKGELIRALEDMPDDTPVMITADYGDRGHTQQVLPITDVLELTAASLADTGYSATSVELLDEANDDAPEDVQNTHVLVIK